ncbi:hypothetical protein [Salinicoccus roseus]|uniref:hypothetical protein n=1 Tax=Salinicoccus roseus TaxID=45670 RepID=UPI001474449F|nr:hypothetical protein [Salinicoccus roseus]
MIDRNLKCNPPSFDNEVRSVTLEERLRQSIGETVVLSYWNDGSADTVSISI